jgi:hypothetical protein
MGWFTKYFYGKYLKYWYFVFFIIVALMIISSYGNKNIKSYQIIFFNSNGTTEKIEEVDSEKMAGVENNIVLLTRILPITKAFIPQKKVNIEF